VNPGFCEKMEVTRVPPGRSLRTTGWEPLLLEANFHFRAPGLFYIGGPSGRQRRP